MKEIAFVLLLCVGLFSSTPVLAQPTASPDKTNIQVGEPVTIILQAPSRSEVVFPSLGDTLSKSIEIISKSKIDTLGVRKELLQQEIVVMAFDTGYLPVPPFEFLIDGKKTRTDAFLLEVALIEMAEDDAPKPDKEILDVPFSIIDWILVYWKYIIGVLGALAAVGVLLWYLTYRRKKRQRQPAPQPEEPVVVRTPAEIALEALEQLKAKRLWETGAFKEHYSEVSFVLRQFIEDELKIDALERTSNQLLSALRTSPVDRRWQASLRNLFQDTDMVKFARSVPDAEAAQEAIRLAQRFVHEHNQSSAESEVPTTNPPAVV